jgi:hypothetical protein
MGYNWQTCHKDLTAQGLNPCDELTGLPYHCNGFSQTTAYHAACAGQAIYQPVQAVMCKNSSTNEVQYFPPDEFFDKCGALHDQDSDWNPGWCYCCCSCFANDTPISTAAGTVAAVQDLEIGDKVLIGSLAAGLSFKEEALRFSSGTPAGGAAMTMVYIVYGPEKKELIVSPDQVLLVQGEKLTTANKLTINDKLIDHDGNEVHIELVSIGHYSGGVHHISADLHWDGTPNNHLVLANGVVGGDYTLQLNFENLDSTYKVDDHSDLANLGNDDYPSQPTGAGSHHIYSHDEATRINSAAQFKAFQAIRKAMPEDSVAMLSTAQTVDILTNGTQFPLQSNIGRGNYEYAAKLLSGFYPGINFHLAWDQFEPNIYSITEYGIQTVVVNGGLVRTQGLTYKGLMMLMAEAVSRFVGGEPRNYLGFSCLGQADFYAFAAIARNIFYLNEFVPMAMAAYNEINTLFGLITPANAGGNSTDKCNAPSIKCRLSAMQSGFAGGSLPTCAGGEAPPEAILEGASATTDKLVLTFSVGLTPDSATNLDNYTVTPDACLTAASLESQDFRVDLAGTFKKDTTYTVTVNNVTTILGTGIDPKANTATFEVS